MILKLETKGVFRHKMKAGAFINAQNIALWITNILMENQS
jgi:hypothetical protein